MKRLSFTLGLLVVLALSASTLYYFAHRYNVAARIAGQIPRREVTILMEMECNRMYRLLAINQDGTDLRSTTWKISYEWCEWVVSPDGEYIAARSEDNSVYLARIDGEGDRRVLRNAHYLPEFSPDSRKIAFMSTNGKYVIENLDGSGQYYFGPKAYILLFSPDGEHIVFTTGESPRYRLYTSDLDGSNQRFIWEGNELYPTFSPDGKSIVFEEATDPNHQLYISEIDGNNKRFLTKGSNPIFSPDGNTIVFSSNQAGGYQMYRIDVDGQHKGPLVPGMPNACCPVFSQDASKIAFQVNSGDSDIEIYVADNDGSGPASIGYGRSVGDVIFSPNGDEIAFSTEMGTFIVPSKGGKTRLLAGESGGNLYWSLLPHIAGEPTISFPGLPNGYYVDQLVSADFDGDSIVEEACTAGDGVPPSLPFGENASPIMLLVAKGDKLISSFKYDYCDRVGGIQALDLTGDGRPELVYIIMSFGASDGTFELYARSWKNGALSNIIGTQDGSLSHLLEGGVVALDNGPGKPMTLVLYDFIWGEGESHADLHRYYAEWYEWRNGKFVQTIRRKTKNKYGENPLREFGIRIPSPNARELSAYHPPI